MLLNRLWIGMFLIALATGLSKLLFWHDLTIFEKMVTSLFDAAKAGFEISLYFTGALCLWLGFMKVGEEGGAIANPAFPGDQEWQERGQVMWGGFCFFLFFFMEKKQIKNVFSY